MFNAASAAIALHKTILYDNDIINAAIWCLSKDPRENEDLGRLRQSALGLLRALATAQISV